MTKALRDGLIHKDQKILEVGSGCLRNSIFLLEKGFQVTAKELPGVVERYRKVYDRFTTKGGRLVVDSPVSGTFDIVLSTFTIETICRITERMQCFGELVQSLRRGGKLVLAVRGVKDVKTAAAKGRRCGDGYITPQKTFVRPFTVKEVVSLLSDRGIRVMKIYGGCKQNDAQIIEIVAEKP